MKPQSAGQSIFLLLDLTELFTQKNINYVIIGAFAASFYGVVRASLDIDAIISLERSSYNIKSLLESIKAKGYSAIYNEAGIDDPIKGLITISDSFYNRVDLLLGINGLDSSFVDRAITTDFNNNIINICSLEDFISMKIFAGSAKDLEDVKNVLKVSKEELNMELVKKLAKNYGEREFEMLCKLLNDN